MASRVGAETFKTSSNSNDHGSIALTYSIQLQTSIQVSFVNLSFCCWLFISRVQFVLDVLYFQPARIKTLFFFIFFVLITRSIRMKSPHTSIVSVVTSHFCWLQTALCVNKYVWDTYYNVVPIASRQPCLLYSIYVEVRSQCCQYVQ